LKRLFFILDFIMHGARPTDAQYASFCQANAANIAELTSRAAGNFPRLTHYQQPAIPTAHAYMVRKLDDALHHFRDACLEYSC